MRTITRRRAGSVAMPSFATSIILLGIMCLFSLLIRWSAMAKQLGGLWLSVSFLAAQLPGFLPTVNQQWRQLQLWSSWLSWAPSPRRPLSPSPLWCHCREWSQLWSRPLCEITVVFGSGQFLWKSDWWDEIYERLRTTTPDSWFTSPSTFNWRYEGLKLRVSVCQDHALPLIVTALHTALSE